MKAKKLSYEEFLESLRLCPRLTVELLVKNKKGEVLLVKRLRPPFKGYWHLPGGFLLKSESITNCAKRLSLEELGFELNLRDGKFLGLFETIKGDPRGHILHYVLMFRLKNSQVCSDNGRFFKNLPPKAIPYQRKFLIKLGYK